MLDLVGSTLQRIHRSHEIRELKLCIWSVWVCTLLNWNFIVLAAVPLLNVIIIVFNHCLCVARFLIELRVSYADCFPWLSPATAVMTDFGKRSLNIKTQPLNSRDALHMCPFIKFNTSKPSIGYYLARHTLVFKWK